MSKSFKPIREGNVEYQFSGDKLKVLTTQKQKELYMIRKQKVTKNMIMNEIAEKTNVSADAVNNWMYCKNGPSDLEQIKEIADYFKVDYHELLEKKTEENVNEKEDFKDMMIEKQKVVTRDRVREIYEALVEAIVKSWRFFYTEWYTSENIDDMVKRYYIEFEEAEDACRTVDYLLTKYMLDIPADLNEKIYSLKWTMAESVLMDTVCLFCEHEEDEMEEVEKELSNMLMTGMEFQEVKFVNKLKPVFEQYIVKQ